MPIHFVLTVNIAVNNDRVNYSKKIYNIVSEARLIIKSHKQVLKERQAAARRLKAAGMKRQKEVEKMIAAAARQDVKKSETLSGK